MSDGLPSDMSLPELKERIALLGTWVRHPSFDRRNTRMRDYALEELHTLRMAVRWLAYRKAQALRDEADWQDALDWVEADAGETLAGVLETLSHSVPHRSEESDENYLKRLRKIRAEFSRGYLLRTREDQDASEA
jgi:hypothetical protein